MTKVAEREQGGLTLVEALFAAAVLAVLLPAIVSALNTTRQTAHLSGQLTAMRQAIRGQMHRMTSELRQARAVFVPGTLAPADFPELADAAGTMHWPNHFSDATAVPYLILPPRGTAIAFMKYETSFRVADTSVDTYRLVIYYTRTSLPGDPDRNPDEPDALSLRRFQSRKAYADPRRLTTREQDAVTARGYALWTPPAAGAAPTEPPQSTMGESRLLTNAVAPPDVRVGKGRVPPPGGFFVSRDGNSFTLHLMGYGAKRTYLLQQTAVARNFVQ